MQDVHDDGVDRAVASSSNGVSEKFTHEEGQVLTRKLDRRIMPMSKLLSLSGLAYSLKYLVSQNLHTLCSCFLGSVNSSTIRCLLPTNFC